MQKKTSETRDFTVRNCVESFFEPIRYSKEVAEAKEKITQTLEPVCAELKRSAGSSFGSAFRSSLWRRCISPPSR